MNWICSQIGAREHYAVARALHQQGMLAGLVTDWYAFQGNAEKLKTETLKSDSGNGKAESVEHGEHSAKQNAEKLKTENLKAEKSQRLSVSASQRFCLPSFQHFSISAFQPFPLSAVRPPLPSALSTLGGGELPRNAGYSARTIRGQPHLLAIRIVGHS